ncbi:MAG: hypothetical protein L7W43_18760, partial [Rubripirellula sp.]|nr:hypothetical protein [Rubripirellula sp.]
ASGLIEFEAEPPVTTAWFSVPSTISPSHNPNKTAAIATGQASRRATSFSNIAIAAEGGVGG